MDSPEPNRPNAPPARGFVRAFRRELGHLVEHLLERPPIWLLLGIGAFAAVRALGLPSVLSAVVVVVGIVAALIWRARNRRRRRRE